MWIIYAFHEWQVNSYVRPTIGLFLRTGYSTCVRFHHLQKNILLFDVKGNDTSCSTIDYRFYSKNDRILVTGGMNSLRGNCNKATTGKSESRNKKKKNRLNVFVLMKMSQQSVIVANFNISSIVLSWSFFLLSSSTLILFRLHIWNDADCWPQANWRVNAYINKWTTKYSTKLSHSQWKAPTRWKNWIQTQPNSSWNLSIRNN